MRIIAGSKKGMKLLSPAGEVSRPIIDRVKESLFDVLYNYGLPEGKLVADLFSGVGSLGLESLSRGAKFVTFVENDAKIVAVLNKNIVKASFVKESKVIRANAFKVGAPVESELGKYELLFVDPPYADTRNVGENSALARLMGILAGQLADGALVVVRTERKTRLLNRYGDFSVLEARQWGGMAVTIFEGARYD